jgi:hypothetical protein
LQCCNQHLKSVSNASQRHNSSRADTSCGCSSTMAASKALIVCLTLVLATIACGGFSALAATCGTSHLHRCRVLVAPLGPKKDGCSNKHTMSYHFKLRVCVIAACVPHVCTTAGQGATNSRADRISQSISASEDAISAVAGSNVRSATAKGKDFAVLATRENTKASDFGRRLQQGRSTRSAAAKHCQPQPVRVRSLPSPAKLLPVLGLQLLAWSKVRQKVQPKSAPKSAARLASGGGIWLDQRHLGFVFACAPTGWV